MSPSGTPSEDVGTKKGKEVSREKYHKIEEVIQEPQNKKQKHGDAPSSPSRTPSVQEIETFERQDAGTSIRRFEQEENLDRPIHDRLSINAYEKSMQERGRDQDISIEESLTTILEREMINDEDGPLEEETPGVAIHLPSVEAVVPEVTDESLGGEEEIDIRAVQRKEQLVILGDQSIPIPEWLRKQIQLRQQREVDPAIELQFFLDGSNQSEEQGKARRYTKFIRGE